MPDKYIPETLNTISVIPRAVETFLFITIIEVDPITLISLIVAAAVGARFGAGIVSKLPERVIQLSMAIALIIAAFTMFAGIVGRTPAGGEAASRLEANCSHSSQHLPGGLLRHWLLCPNDGYGL